MTNVKRTDRFDLYIHLMDKIKVRDSFKEAVIRKIRTQFGERYETDAL